MCYLTTLLPSTSCSGYYRSEPCPKEPGSCLVTSQLLTLKTSRNNLAGLYWEQCRYGEAEPLYRDALTLRQRLLGDDHPAVATSMNNLAGLYRSQGRYGEAEPLYLEALRILFQRLGQDHPNTQTVLGNFFGFLQAVVAAGQAESLSDHPITQALLTQIQP
ncbi:MAG: tetratricopeptide repeat protein [Leptolyngbyaceae cyanobacterium SM2_5_2]|nr:tetratricopeptide repeat protein [Leptolyngbyaceae cyanobacterium SM2_5_2]